MAAVFYHHCCLYICRLKLTLVPKPDIRADMWTSKTGARRSPRELTFVPTGTSQAPTSAFGH